MQARFNLLRAAYQVCLEDDQFGIRDNPTQYVKIRNVESEGKTRDAFTVDQLQTLFDAPVFTAGDRPVGGRGDTSFWAPLIALFTGARLAEVLCLRTDGLYSADGVVVFHFRHRPELGQNLKGTRASTGCPRHRQRSTSSAEGSAGSLRGDPCGCCGGCPAPVRDYEER